MIPPPAITLYVGGTNGTAERRASEDMLKAERQRVWHLIRAGEDKAGDIAEPVAASPHVGQNNAPTKTGTGRYGAINGRTTRDPGYRLSRSRGPMFECIFGWGKQHGTVRKTKHRGHVRISATARPFVSELRERVAISRNELLA